MWTKKREDTHIMKKRILLATVFCFIMMASGCSNKNTEETTASKGETSSETSTEATSEAAAAERPEYKALDYVTLGEYKGLEVTLISAEPTEEEVQTQVDTQFLSDVQTNDKMEKKEEGKVADGDVVNIDYEGKVDGEAFDGGTDKGSNLEIGSNSFIEGFESGLIGVAVGDTVDLDLTFPDEYQSEELAGQAAVFTVTVNYIQVTPEMTDEIIAEISDFKTVDEYKENIKNSLIETMKESQKNQQLQDLMEQIYNNSTINGYPQEMIDYNVNQTMDYLETYAVQSEITVAELIEQQYQMTEDEFKEQLIDSVKQSLDQEMLIKAIIETEGLTLTDAEYEAGVEKYATELQAESTEAFIEQYGKSVIELAILQDKVLDLIIEEAVVTEASETESETATETASETTAE